MGYCTELVPQFGECCHVQSVQFQYVTPGCLFIQVFFPHGLHPLLGTSLISLHHQTGSF